MWSPGDDDERMDEPVTAGLRAVVFDFDGLVLDTEWCEYATAADVFAEHGTELSLDLWKTFIGTTDHPHWTDILGEQLGRPVDRDELTRRRRAAHQAGSCGLPAGVRASRRGPCDRGRDRGFRQRRDSRQGRGDGSGGGAGIPDARHGLHRR